MVRDNSKKIIIALISFVFLNGCAVVLQKGRRSDTERIQSLEEKKRLQVERIGSLEKEIAGLMNIKSLLEEKLSKELADKQVRIEMEGKGLVVTFVAEVLFDSGKAKLRKKSFSSLDKVAQILTEEVPNNDISVEGHTDNIPIKFSKWRSNWELSAHRALSVLHYLQSKGINPQMLSATGFGEYKPIASNDLSEGKQLNRRVEIVIIPESIKKAKQKSLDKPVSDAAQENLK